MANKIKAKSSYLKLFSKENREVSVNFFLITFLVILVDQVTKILVKTFNPRIDFFFINISYSTNTGAAFGIFQGNSFLLGLFSLVFVACILIFYPKIPRNKSYQFFTALLLAGSFGNMLDRLIRGEVIDFIASSIWPSFNVADMAITIAAIGIIALLCFEKD